MQFGRLEEGAEGNQHRSYPHDGGCGDSPFDPVLHQKAYPRGLVYAGSDQPAGAVSALAPSSSAWETEPRSEMSAATSARVHCVAPKEGRQRERVSDHLGAP